MVLIFFIKRTIDYNPENRPSASQLKQWLQNSCNQNLHLKSSKSPIDLHNGFQTYRHGDVTLSISSNRPNQDSTIFLVMHILENIIRFPFDIDNDEIESVIQEMKMNEIITSKYERSVLLCLEGLIYAIMRLH